MSERALVFGSAAAAYERYRFGYQDVLADLVLAYARDPIQTAVEIGAGTGKATRLFDGRGISITAVEPDAAMIEVGAGAGVWRSGSPPDSSDTVRVRAVQATLENFTTEQTFDLLYAGAAWHWTQAETRWDRTAALVRPGGSVALFGGPTDLADADLRERYRAVQRSAGVEAAVAPPGPTSAGGMQWPGTELEADDRFTDVEQHQIERTLTVDADDYVGQLTTVSAFLMLPPEQRRTMFQQVRELLPAKVVMESQLTLHLARRC